MLHDGGGGNQRKQIWCLGAGLLGLVLPPFRSLAQLTFLLTIVCVFLGFGSIIIYACILGFV
jgi:hypothetical protein